MISAKELEREHLAKIGRELVHYLGNGGSVVVTKDTGGIYHVRLHSSTCADIDGYGPTLEDAFAHTLQPYTQLRRF